MTGPEPGPGAATRTVRPANPVVLYIAGPGRSGSTLLDLVLGQVDGVVSIGELRNLWYAGFHGAWPCGCGKPVTECPFWSAVLARAFGSVESVCPESMQELRCWRRSGIAPLPERCRSYG